MAKEYKLDLFANVLPNIDKKNTNFYDNLSVDEAKEIQPVPLIRWLSGTTDAKQVFFLNEFVNPYLYSFGSKHKKLLVRLMMICTSGKVKRYKYPKTKKPHNTPKALAIVKTYLGYSTRHAKDALNLISTEDIISFAEQLGTQKADITALKKELKTR